MKFARYTFLIAGIYGLIVLIPQYFMEAKVSADYPPAITHPEYFYGFLGVAIAFQIVFLIISTDPIKYRLLMIAAMVEKFSFVIAVALMFYSGKMPLPIIAGAAIDLLLGTLFIISWLKVRNDEAASVSSE